MSRPFTFGILGGLLAILVGVYAQGYQARDGLVVQARAGCERSKLDRGANAAGWRTAQVARLRAAEGEPRGQAVNDLQAAARYDRIARSLEMRQRIDCAAVYPRASPLPFG